MQPANPVNPQRVAWELSPRLPERAIITSDSGSCANWYARDLKIRRGMMCSLSGGLASMGAAVPYAIAAKFAHPGPAGDRAGRRRRHADEQHGRADHGREILAAVVQPDAGSCCVFNNEDLNQVTWEQRVHGGRSRSSTRRSSIPDVPYHKFAELIGLQGHLRRRPRPRRRRPGTRRWPSDRPVVLEVKTDPKCRRCRRTSRSKQAKNVHASTLLKGDPDEGSVLIETAQEVLSTVLPGSRS